MTVNKLVVHISKYCYYIVYMINSNTYRESDITTDYCYF